MINPHKQFNIVMGTIFAAGVVCIAVALLTPSKVSSKSGVMDIDHDVWIFKDPENGCEYISFRGIKGALPRMNPEGKQICR